MLAGGRGGTGGRGEAIRKPGGNKPLLTPAVTPSPSLSIDEAVEDRADRVQDGAVNLDCEDSREGFA